MELMGNHETNPKPGLPWAEPLNLPEMRRTTFCVLIIMLGSLTPATEGWLPF
jgi:hypothetical protein